MKKYEHKHNEKIVRLSMYFETDVQIRKNTHTNIWEVCKCGIDFPHFLNYIEYKIVAKKHLDIALEYYNDEENNLGKMLSTSANFSKLYVDFRPHFFHDVKYEFKKEI